MDSTPPRHEQEQQNAYTRVSDGPYTRAGRLKLKPKLTSLEEGLTFTPTRRAYRFASPTDDELRTLSEAYTRVTGRKVWPKMIRSLAVAWRMHGPNAAAILERLHDEHGVEYLLPRWIAYETTQATEPAPQAEARLRVVEAATGQSLPVQLSTGAQLRAVASATPDDGWLDTPAGRAAREQWLPIPASAGPKPAQVAAIYADLPYGPDESPPFDPESTARYDVHLRRCLDFLGHQTALLPDGTPAHHRAAGNVWVCEICEVAA